MAEVIEVVGKTIEEALNTAVTKLGVSKEEVSYEIIEKPTSGFLGFFGVKPAKLRVTHEPRVVASISSSSVTDSDRQSIGMNSHYEVDNTPNIPSISNEPILNSNNPAVTNSYEVGKSTVASNALVSQAGYDNAISHPSSAIIDAGDTISYAPISSSDASYSNSEEAGPIKLTRANPEIYTLAEEVLHSIFEIMQLEVTLKREDTADGTIYNISGGSLGILIGKHGQTLESLQYLTNLVANKNPINGYQRIILDVEDYRTRREETLKRLATRLAEKVCRIHREVHLEPMSRHERKIIHMTLQGNRRVTTYSAGENPRRFVVIAPKRRDTRSERGDVYNNGYSKDKCTSDNNERPDGKRSFSRYESENDRSIATGGGYSNNYAQSENE